MTRPSFFYHRAFHAYSDFGFIWGRVVFRVSYWNRKAVTQGIHFEWWRMKPETTIDGRTIYR